MKLKNLKIVGKRFNLRKFRMSDISSIQKHINDKGVYKYTLKIPHPYSLDDAKKFVHKTSYKWKTGKAYQFGIEVDNEIVGGISLDKIDKDNQSATLGYWLGKKHWSQGIMTEASKMILEFAFNDLKLRRINSGVFKPNKASARVLEKAGFKYEGCRIKYVLKDGKTYDQLHHGLLKEDWKK